MKSKNRFRSNAVFHAAQETGFVGAGVNGRHRFDMQEVKKRKAAADKESAKEEPDADEVDPMMVDGDMDDAPTHVHHAKKIAKHAKKLGKIAVDIGHRISEMQRMGLD